MAAPPEELLFRYIEPEPNSSCWIWVGSCLKGYGHLSYRDNGRRHHVYAHRLAYQLMVGPIPQGKELDHLCRVRSCCNPKHLEPVTSSENKRRSPLAGMEMRRVNALIHAGITHCPQGHLYDAANTYVSKRNQRSCRECNRADALARYRRTKHEKPWRAQRMRRLAHALLAAK